MRHEEFTWNMFIDMVNYMSCKDTGRPFTKLEQELLRCYWNNLSDLDILEVLEKKRSELDYYYDASSFLRLGFKPNVMAKLSRLIGHPVNRNNFKKVFQWIWERGDAQIPVKIEVLETIKSSLE